MMAVSVAELTFHDIGSLCFRLLSWHQVSASRAHCCYPLEWAWDGEQWSADMHTQRGQLYMVSVCACVCVCVRVWFGCLSVTIERFHDQQIAITITYARYVFSFVNFLFHVRQFTEQ